ASEETQLDNPALTRIDLRECIKCRIQSDNVGTALGCDTKRLIQRQHPIPSSAFEVIPGSRVINENTSHELSGDSKEVRAVLPAHVPNTNEPLVGLMDQSCRLQCVAREFPAQVPVRDSPQLVIHERHQFI